MDISFSGLMFECNSRADEITTLRFMKATASPLQISHLRHFTFIPQRCIVRGVEGEVGSDRVSGSEGREERERREERGREQGACRRVLCEREDGVGTVLSKVEDGRIGSSESLVLVAKESYESERWKALGYNPTLHKPGGTRATNIGRSRSLGVLWVDLKRKVVESVEHAERRVVTGSVEKAQNSAEKSRVRRSGRKQQFVEVERESESKE
ncbi:hypothetical protein BJ742DRAFT_901961 [Cladochytrium replicatum]|nr:hypothetical protein BJ742DRAFT_901961 [Cladochytrium replicatum]